MGWPEAEALSPLGQRCRPLPGPSYTCAAQEVEQGLGRELVALLPAGARQGKVKKMERGAVKMRWDAPLPLGP